MNRWIAVKNIEDFRRKLDQEIDPYNRRVLAELIAKEMQKLREREPSETPIQRLIPSEG